LLVVFNKWTTATMNSDYCAAAVLVVTSSLQRTVETA